MDGESQPERKEFRSVESQEPDLYVPTLGRRHQPSGAPQRPGPVTWSEQLRTVVTSGLHLHEFRQLPGEGTVHSTKQISRTAVVCAGMTCAERRSTDGVTCGDTGEHRNTHAYIHRSPVLDVNELGDLEVRRSYPQPAATVSLRRRSGLSPLGVHFLVEEAAGDRAPSERREPRNTAASSDPASRTESANQSSTIRSPEFRSSRT